jgi:hypothetical protein
MHLAYTIMVSVTIEEGWRGRGAGAVVGRPARACHGAEQGRVGSLTCGSGATVSDGYTD